MKKKLSDDEKYMQRCLQLARQGLGYVAPNPLVGALLVVDGKIIGEGYHKRYGEAHAEPNAINSVEDKGLLKKATMYVSLEPCSHYGNTPPCANLIVQSGIPRVVIGTLDPNPKVSGRGVKILEEAGIEVSSGYLEVECRKLNKRFFMFQEQKRPYILLKWAQTSDGFIDCIRTHYDEMPLQISNSLTSQLTHKMRSENQSIMVSTNTVVLDNPSLTVRNWPGKSPIRIALDRSGRIPMEFKILDQSVRTLIFTEQNKESNGKIEYINIDFNKNCIQNIVNEIYNRNIHSILIEGGAKLLNSFIDSGIWDEAHVEISSQKIFQGVAAPKIGGRLDSHETFLEHDILTYFRV